MRNAEVIRQWKILKRIEAGRYTTAQDLADEHGVTERTIRRDIEALQEAGCFALVLEAVPAEVAAAVTERLRIPTIGIGAGPATDGQVLVLNDLLGIFEEFKPRFVKRYAHLRREMAGAVGSFAADVRARRFPTEEHCYAMEPGGRERFLASLEADA